MGVAFPVNAKVRSTAADVPPPPNPTEVGIFDNRGFWASFGDGALSLPGDQLDLGLKIAAMINEAYEQGRRDQARAIREALEYGTD